MSENKDYYGILGVDKNATEEEIKKHYKKLAVQWHPDKFATASEEERKNAEEKFQEIAEAYDVLSNPQKRAQYDNGGVNFDFNGFNPSDIFEHMQNGFNGFEGFGSFFNMGRKNRQEKGSDISTDLNITLEEAYKGGKYTLHIRRDKPCIHCNGTGSADGTNPVCPHCNGTGFVSQMHQNGPGSFSMTSSPCPHCKGTGKIVKTPCTHCNGTGFESEYVDEVYEIPRGLSDGMTIRIPNAGNKPKGQGINGNLFINVHVKNDPYFVRPDDINVIHYEEIPFNEALLGFKKDFKCVDGSTVTVDAPELTEHEHSFVFKGKGMPNPNNPSHFGDYAVIILHKLPSKLTDKQKEILRNFD